MKSALTSPVRRLDSDRATADLRSKAILVAAVLVAGLLCGFQFAAWYLLRNLSPEAFVRDEDKAALFYAQAMTEHWWVWCAILLVVSGALVTRYRVTRR